MGANRDACRQMGRSPVIDIDGDRLIFLDPVDGDTYFDGCGRQFAPGSSMCRWEEERWDHPGAIASEQWIVMIEMDRGNPLSLSERINPGSSQIDCDL